MKCPRCGAWNQASLPRCFRCGQPLSPDNAAGPDWRQELSQDEGREKVFVDIDAAAEKPQPETDSGDELAIEMQQLRARKLRGMEEQRRLRSMETQPYSARVAGRVQQSTTRRRYVVDSLDELRQPTRRQRRGNFAEHQPQREPARPIDYDDCPPGNTSAYTPLGVDGKPLRSIYSDDQPVSGFQHPQFRPVRLFRIVFLLVLAAGLTLGGLYYFKLPPFSLAETAPLQDRVQISTSIYDDLPAHIIRIPAEDGSEIYIKELHTTGIAIGGYATFEVPDYKWYENQTDIEDEIFTVTMTPYLKTAGQQRLMDTIHFDIEIPLSPITLVSPDVLYVEVNSRPKYQIQFKVERGSTVTINGENYSDLVSSQDGLISYNATVQAIGENNIVIECQTKYYRKNTVTMVLYREPQAILLELDSSISERWSGDTNTMTVSGTTLNKATIRVLSDHRDLDTSKLLSTGTFSFTAVFNRIGTNTITIEASYPGKQTTVVNFDVYHVPSARNYTPRAWPMDAYNYTQYLDTLATRVRTTTIYVCKGTITEIISDSPQRALMETGTETSSRKVLLDNLSNDTWEVGDSLRVYGDAYGAYDGKPWLIGRYTYPYNP